MFGLAHFNDLLTVSRALNEPQPAPSKSAFQQECMETPGSETI